jgi:pteridine reductase
VLWLAATASKLSAANMGSGANRVAVVTGGAKRIGRAIAVHLHQRGFDIGLHYRSSGDSAQALADEMCDARPGSCELFQADLQELSQVGTLATQLCERYPAIDLLVNNASGFAPTPITTCTPEQFDSMLDANLRGPYFLIQGLLPAMRAGGASIINLLDVHVERPLPQFNVYGAAKSGMASLTRSLAVELAPDIRVNGIAPGAILWPEGDASYDAAMRAKTIEDTPLKRLGDPLDIAHTVGFLACDAPFITGQLIVVDGGRSLVG